jgi:hypothetical protein
MKIGKNIMRALLLTLLFCATASAQAINYRENVEPGELVVVEADAKPGSAIVWAVFQPGNLRYFNFEENRYLVCSAGLQPRVIQGMVTIVNWEEKELTQLMFYITVGDAPGPPEPPVNFGLEEVSREAVSKVPKEYRGYSKELAASLRKALELETDSSAELLDEIRKSNKSALGPVYNLWLPWGHEIAKAMEPIEDVLIDVNKLRIAYREVIAGLESVQLST